MKTLFRKISRLFPSLLGTALVIILAGTAAACSDDDLKITADVDIPEEGGLTGVLESYNCVIPLTITSDSDWEIQFDKDGTKMAYAYPESGTGNATVKVCILGNYDEVRRSGVLTIHFPQDESKDRTVKMVQKARSESGENYDKGSVGDQSYGIGFGFYGADGMDPSVCVRPYRILKVEAMQEAGEVTKAAGSKFELKVHSYAGSTISELSNDFTTTADFEGGACGFNAEINASFNMKDFSNEQYEYSMTYIDVEEERITITSSPTNWIKKDMICEDAYSALNNDYDIPDYDSPYPSTDEGFRKLVKDYGTHVIIAATLGGRLRSSTTYNVSKMTKEYDVEAYAKLSYSGIVDASASVDEAYKNSYESNKSACNTTLTAWGANNELSTAVALARGEENVNSAVRDWISDLNQNESSWQYIGPAKKNDLVPIWELVKSKSRRDSLQTFIEEKRYLDNSTSYDLGVIGHLVDVDALDEELNDPDYQGTLIRNVTIGKNNNKTIAKLCSEFIPEINEAGRVLVFYPVLNGVTKWNLGYFPGNSYHKPARISNYGGEIKVVTYTDGTTTCPQEIYLRGGSITAKEIDGETELVEASTKDYFLNSYKNDGSEKGGVREPGDQMGTYPLVKVLDHVWMRENYTGSRRAGDDQYLSSLYWRPYYYDKQTQTILYYVATIHGNNPMLPTDWKFLTTSAMDHILSVLKQYGINHTKAFLKDGLLGTDVTLDGYIFWDMNNIIDQPPYVIGWGEVGYIYANPSFYSVHDRPGYRFDESGVSYVNWKVVAANEPFYSVRFIYPIE